MKTGVIDTGGGMRGIFATGVLDSCIERGIWFDLGIGISAGSANVFLINQIFPAYKTARCFTHYIFFTSRIPSC